MTANNQNTDREVLIRAEGLEKHFKGGEIKALDGIDAEFKGGLWWLSALREAGNPPFCAA